MTVEEEFAQLSPLLDRVVELASGGQNSPQERAAVMALLMSRFAVAARKMMLAALFSPQQMDRERSEQLGNLLIDSFAQADAEIEAMAEAYAQAGRPN